MSGAAPAYDYEYARSESRRATGVRQGNDRRVKVVHGRRNEESVSSGFFMVAGAIAAICIFIALIACCRIALDTATVNVMLENDVIENKIDAIREESQDLEVEEATASNPTNLKKAAKKLGMSVPYSTETIELEDDVVAYDEDGNLSLSNSLAVAAEG